MSQVSVTECVVRKLEELLQNRTQKINVVRNGTTNDKIITAFYFIEGESDISENWPSIRFSRINNNFISDIGSDEKLVKSFCQSCKNLNLSYIEH